MSVFKVSAIIILLVCVSFANSLDQCKQNGEYCINHLECCSNNCVSYLYKCTKKLQELAAPVVDSRFGEAEKITDINELILRTFGSEPPTSLSTQTEGKYVVTDGEVTKNSQEIEGDTTTLGYSKTKPPCLEIGSKCFHNDECCSERCHGFLHQCVT